MKTHDFGGRAYVLLRSEGEELDTEARRLMSEELSRLPDGEHEACIEALCRANPLM